MVWWVVDLDLSPFQLVFLGTVMEALVLLAESPTGVVADVFSRKWSIVLSWTLMGVASLLTPVSSSYVLILVWQGLWGLGYTFQSGADTAWVTDESEGVEDAEENDSLIMAKAIAMAVGMIFGVSTSIFMSQWSLRGSMAIAGVATIGFGAFLAVAMTERNFTPADRSERGTLGEMVSIWRRGVSLISGRRVLRIVIVATFVMSMVDEIVDRLDFARMRELGFSQLDGAESAATFGAIWVGMTILSVPAMVYVHRRSRGRDDRASAMWMTALLLVAATSVGFMAGNVVALALVGWVFRDVIRELLEPIGEAWVNRHAESEIRATVISFRSQSMAMGEVLGGLLLGTLAELVGLQVGFATGAALLALSGLTVGRLIGSREEPGRTAGADARTV